MALGLNNPSINIPKAVMESGNEQRWLTAALIAAVLFRLSKAQVIRVRDKLFQRLGANARRASPCWRRVESTDDRNAAAYSARGNDVMPVTVVDIRLGAPLCTIATTSAQTNV
jgi:hypothetical protein